MGLEEYVDFHKSVMNGSNPRQKYAMCVARNGIGNWFQIVISCLLYGMISKRAVLLAPNSGTFNMEERFLPPPFDLWKIGHLQGRMPNDELDQVNNTMGCDDLTTIPNNEVVHITGNWGYDYFGQTLLVNPHFQMFEKMPDNVYSLIHNYVFKLRPTVQREIDEFKALHFGKYNIAIQIRYPILKTKPGTFYKGKKDHEGVPVPPWELFGTTAYQLSHKVEGVDYEDVKWYLATQNRDLIQLFRERYGEDKIIFYDGKIVTTFDNDKEGQMTSFITWWLFGECDDVITTEVSTFGVTGAARGGIAPVVCNHGRFCSRKLSPHPCQQTPYRAGDDYHIYPPTCLNRERQTFNSVESSCAFFGGIVVASKKYQEGADW